MLTAIIIIWLIFLTLFNISILREFRDLTGGADTRTFKERVQQRLKDEIAKKNQNSKSK